MKLYFESILDDDDDFYDPKNDKKEIENWIRSNYRVTGKLTILKDYTVNCTGNVYSTNGTATSLTNGLFKWGKINKNFSCALCDIKSLEDAPKKVGGYFSCINCDNLISLEGASEEVGETFKCTSCKNLTSLKGAPKKVGGDFMCAECNNLTTLEGAPEKVGGCIGCNYCNKLNTLKGSPEEVGGSFNCIMCDNLTSLEGAPKKIGGIFSYKGCEKVNQNQHDARYRTF